MGVGIVVAEVKGVNVCSLRADKYRKKFFLFFFFLYAVQLY